VPAFIFRTSLYSNKIIDLNIKTIALKTFEAALKHQSALLTAKRNLSNTQRFYTHTGQESTIMDRLKQTENQGFYALIAAAGKSTRMNGAVPKPYMRINGKSVLRQSIETFQSIPECRGVLVIIHTDDADSYHEAIMGLDLPPYIEGSSSRKLSIYNGLKSFDDLKSQDIILIHDAARPCVSSTDIINLLQAMKNAQAATLAIPVSDTLCRGDDNIEMMVARNEMWQIQTPQAFHYGLIRKAHETFADDDSATDDTALIAKMGIDVKLVQGSRNNIKITYPEDIAMAEALLSTSQIFETRIGQGFDVHAFERDDKTRKLILGGIEIPGAPGLKGHSDADVALHALTDALLGALGEHDIGHHFPPSDNAFKNMDSAKFLDKAVEILGIKDGKIINADLTIICEAPKIGPYRNIMRQRIAQILKIDQARVNVKATTTEKLGFTGRGEGIAAQAIVSIAIPAVE
jgi:2-C-methyl-D-erythritol 4-phosphate cytidylyltransferase/2-C-methyl-D-erythritol 2,4-cyclodiphosphate synthase